ncbi:CBS domain-containing protein [Waterburya agarophytonicola K14]|uniref:CBS domain-containing protein n=1 Tax=Waterburya agarophytonicola KI4 TaxID=2874699 RepID=A0A964BQI1_9CYAN|nr:CBS domain-containing protein [Waterburya agarophytonicola]MCC0176281.1 CBS domain-containing protein [Waterburya agarophytonicola KI4]
MESNNHLDFASPDLETAIDREPLIVTPDISLVQAIALMGRAVGVSCGMGDKSAELDFSHSQKSRSGCVLVMEESKLLGILTERDIVKLTARELSFEDVTVAEVMTRPVVILSKSNFKDIFAALFLFRRYRIRHLPLVDESNCLLGVISPGTIRQAMRPANLLKLRRVADVMSKNVIHAPINATVLDIARLMTENRVSCIVIVEVDEAENILIPVGIITERDILQFKFLQARLDNLEAGQVMSTPLFLLSPEDSLLMANQEMQRRKVRRLVVSWNWGQGLGIVTQTSILRIFDPMEMYGVIETLQSTVQQLEREKAELLALVEQKEIER